MGDPEFREMEDPLFPRSLFVVDSTWRVRMDHRLSRNDPCPCGSGKKYKNCCRRKEVEAQSPRPSPNITDLDGNPKKRRNTPSAPWPLYGPNDTITTKIAASVIKSTSRADPSALGCKRCDYQPQGPA